MINFKYINFQKIKESLQNYVLDKKRSKEISGYASIDRPWEKRAYFVTKKIVVPDEPFINLILNRPLFNRTEGVLRCHEAIITDEKYNEEVLKCKNSLLAKGVKKGDIVCLCMNETIETMVIEGAINLIGAISANLPSNASVLGIKEYIKNFNTKFIFASDQYFEKVDEATKDTDIERVVVPTGYSYRGMEKLSTETIEWINSNKIDVTENEKTKRYESFLDEGIGFVTTENIEVHASDPAKILFTSGSTGSPKAILLSNGNISAELIRLKNQTHMNLGTKGVCLKVVADMYPYGDIVSKFFPIYVGKCVGLTPTLNETNAFYYMDLYKPPFVQGIPSFYFSMENDKRFEETGLSYFKYAVSGGEKYETNAKRRSNEFLKRMGSSAVILDGSGAGELVACTTTAVGSKYNIESVGKPMVGLNVKIIDEDSAEKLDDAKELKYNENGLICYSGETLMLEYYNNPEKTKENIFYDSEGKKWFATDGIGHMDENGYLYIIGRKARCFIAYDENGSAYKISPEEIENIIKQCEEVEECAVVSFNQSTDESTVRKVPKVYLRLRPGCEFSEELEDKIVNLCKNSTLPTCSVPKIVKEWIGDWPRINETKVDYKKIQQISDEEEKERIRRPL